MPISKNFVSLIGLLACVTPLPGYTLSQPIVIDGQQNVTVSGVKISSATVPCIIIRNNSQNIRVENSELGPCPGGIIVDNSQDVTVDNVYVHDTNTNGNGVDITFSDNVTVVNSRFERTRTGVYALSSTVVKIEYNSFLNVVGPFPRGQVVAFDKITGGGNSIKCNTAINEPGNSVPEDAILLYRSGGLSTDRLMIVGNKIKGGGPSTSGGGINIGDSGGQDGAWDYMTASDNILVDPGQYGMQIGGGDFNEILDNKIYASQQSFTNVGIAVWEAYGSTVPCSNETASGNSVQWTNSAGNPNPNWTDGNCGTITDWSNNDWNASIDESIFYSPIAACAQAGQNRHRAIVIF